MPAQNLVSAHLAPETKTEILKAISDVRNRLEFLLSLQTKEIQGIFKASSGFAPFLELCYQATNKHPEILPNVFDATEFKQDYLLSRDLSEIASEIAQLSDALEKTLMAVNSDSMTAGLEVYAAVKQNRDKVAGLGVVADKMGEFFKRTPKAKTAARTS